MRVIAACVPILLGALGCAHTVREREVSVGPAKLGGTLSEANVRPAPALLLVSGSGANDRDNTIGPNKPFRDLARGLAARGIAVLRYDTRAHRRGTHAVLPATLHEEIVEDALAAVTLLQHEPAVDSARIFVLGHSLAGTAIPRIARERATIRGLVIMGGATRPLEDVLVDQVTFTASLDGIVDDAERPILERLRRQAARVRTLADGAEVSPAELPLSLPPSYWLDLEAHPATELLARETRPVLILHADRDYQSTAADYAGWRRALGAKPNASFRRYAGLNHLFMTANDAGPIAYRSAGQVAQEVIEDLAAWIVDNAR
jgi:dienelactone hydrolase